MKKLLMCAFIFMAVIFLNFSPAGAADTGEIIFCENFDNDFMPSGVNTEFTGPAISMIALPGKAFGVPVIYISLYKQDGSRQTLLSRDQAQINPEWNGYGIRNFPVPGEGTFLIALTTEGGETLAQGSFTITSMDASKKAPPEETLGATLKDLFNKYSPMKK